MITILETRDIAGLFYRLQRRGTPQRKIAQLTGQQQSEISEILAGRQVNSYEVLLRIAVGLGIPRGRMGLGYQLRTPPPGDDTEGNGVCMD